MPETLAIDGGTPVREQMLPYAHQLIDASDVAAVTAVLSADYLTTGPAVEEFERAFADQVGAQYAVAVSSGTAALHAAAFAARLGPGNEAVVPAMTFAATANCCRFQGADVVFADVDPDTLEVDPGEVRKRLTGRTRAIIAVDYAGQPCDLDALRSLAVEHELTLIEDASHALGACLDDRPVGSIADLTTFSFHPAKQITTAEGGMVTTDDADMADRLRRFRNHGISVDHRRRGELNSWFYEITDLGYNYRLSDLQCALGLSQLQRLEDFLLRRAEIAERYLAALHDLVQVSPLEVLPRRRHAWHLYVIRLQLERLRTGRDEVFRALRAENIGVNVHYIPVPMHPYYRDLKPHPTAWPVARSAYESILSLPLWPGMSNSDVDDVAEAVHKVINAYAA